MTVSSTFRHCPVQAARDDIAILRHAEALDETLVDGQFQFQLGIADHLLWGASCLAPFCMISYVNFLHVLFLILVSIRCNRFEQMVQQLPLTSQR